MPTLIDSFVVGMGLESKEFQRGAKDAIKVFKATKDEARKTADDIEQRGKQAAMFFSRLRNEALTFFAVFTAGVGIKDFIGNTLTGAASLGRMSANLRMSTQDLAAYQRANERAGGSGEGMLAQLKESAAEAAKYRMGLAPGNVAAFGKYGGDFSSFKDGNKYLLERSRIVAEWYKKSPADAAVVAQELGISEDTFNLIKQGPAAMEALIEAQRKNAVVTAADAEEADKLRIKLLDLRDTLTGTATRIVLTLAPVLERLLDHFQNLAQWVADNRDVIAEWLDAAVTAFIAFAKATDTAVESLGGWKVVIGALVALKLGGVIAQFVALAAAIGSVGKAATLLPAWLIKLGVGAGLLLHSAGLNEGEDDELARRRALGFQGDRLAGTAGDRSTQDKVMDSLQAKGWTRAQAAGLAANLHAESAFNPAAVGDGGKAYGIAQWHPDRQAAFKKRFGKDIRESNLEEQLEFVDYELREGNERAAGDALRKEVDARGAAWTVSDKYERPADATGDKASARGSMAVTFDAAEKARMAAWVAANPDNAQSATVGAARGGSSNTSTSETHIGEVKVYTQATDAQGIARDLGGALKNTLGVGQSNTGFQ